AAAPGDVLLGSARRPENGPACPHPAYSASCARLLERVEIRGDVPRIGVAHPQIWHGDPRLDRLRVLDPAGQVVRGVGQLAGDVLVAGKAGQRWAYAPAGAGDTGDDVASATAVGSDCLGAASRVAAWHRLRRTRPERGAGQQ